MRMEYTRAGSSGRVYTFTLAAAPGCGAQGVGKRVNYHLRRVTDIIGNKTRARIHDFLIALVIYPREGIDSSFFFVGRRGEDGRSRVPINLTLIYPCRVAKMCRK